MVDFVSVLKPGSGFRCNQCLAPVTREGVAGPPVKPCACQRNFVDENGVLFFAGSPEVEAERRFYDAVYAQSLPQKSATPIDDLAKEWSDPWSPENQAVLEVLGDLAGKRVLLLGNGGSEKELMFLKMNPSELIYSDLSGKCISAIKDRFDIREYRDALSFAAIDALDLPLEDASIDVVYGYAMVHHLPDVNQFLTEIARVLKPGGRAVFMDDAYAPLWYYSKTTLLYPLMKYTHWRHGISGEDLRATMEGGYRPHQLSSTIFGLGGQPFHVRRSFVQYLWSRAAIKLLPQSLQKLVLAPRIGRSLDRIDRAMSRFGWYRANLIRLVWGFEKPVDARAADPDCTATALFPQAGRTSA
jgi:SAM-dependent methyltransferase